MDNFRNLLLVAAALAPAIILCVYVYRKDRLEKESPMLLAKLLVLGAIMCIPAALGELIVEDAILNTIFDKYITFDSAENEVFASETIRHIYEFFNYFFGVAAIEEGLKLLVLEGTTRKNKEYNCLFDGIIYAIFVSLGFAAFENVLYVLENGFVNALMRGVLSVPGHMFFAVMMGYYYSLRHITDNATQMERSLKKYEIIPLNCREFDSVKYRKLSFFVPVMVHGTYNYCCSYGTTMSIVVLIVFMVFMYIYCFGKIRKMSLRDAPNVDYAYAMILKKYPGIEDRIRAKYSGSDNLK